MDVPIYEQTENIIRFAASFMLLFIIWPRFLYKRESTSLEEHFFIGYVQMTVLVIVLGYLLVVIRLYEFLSFTALLLVITLIWNLHQRKSQNVQEGIVTRVNVALYKLLDKEGHPGQWFSQKVKKGFNRLRRVCISVLKDPAAVLIVIILLGSAYLRFIDAMSHAAPSMSDAYVTLAWTKYMEKNILFHDGIYPHGFHLYLAALRKFSGSDALYILKFAGPLNGVLTTLGIYYFVKKGTNNNYAGVAAAFAFGILGQYLPLGWDRQGSANAQEFAMVFLAPSWYYTVAYFRTKERPYLLLAAACYLLIGLIHTFVWICMAIGVICFWLPHLLAGIKMNFKPAVQIAVAGVLSGIISALPFGLGLLMGRELHSTSVEFVSAKVDVIVPALSLVEYTAILGMVFIVLSLPFFKVTKSSPAFLLSIVLLSGLTLYLYRYLGPETGNAVLMTRTGIMWAVVAAAGIGVGWWAFISLIPFRFGLKIQPVLCLSALIIFFNLLRPIPAYPYKMQYDSMVNQYMKIGDEFPPTTWMIVSSSDGYSLVLGKGWHMQLKDFVEQYDPHTPKITKLVEDQEEVLNIDHLFFIIEKDMMTFDFQTMIEILKQREYNYGRLKEWAEEYAKYHDNIEVYYEDSKIKVYHISQAETSRQEADIWQLFGREE